jgi:hypothetical protein
VADISDQSIATPDFCVAAAEIAQSRRDTATEIRDSLSNSGTDESAALTRQNSEALMRLLRDNDSAMSYEGHDFSGDAAGMSEKSAWLHQP